MEKYWINVYNESGRFVEVLPYRAENINNLRKRLIQDKVVSKKHWVVIEKQTRNGMKKIGDLSADYGLVNFYYKTYSEYYSVYLIDKMTGKVMGTVG